MRSQEYSDWASYKIDDLLQTVDTTELSMLPSTIRELIADIALQAFNSGYNWGRQDQSSYLTRGIEPIHTVPKQSTLLHTVEHPHAA